MTLAKPDDRIWQPASFRRLERVTAFHPQRTFGHLEAYLADIMTDGQRPSINRLSELLSGKEGIVAIALST